MSYFVLGVGGSGAKLIGSLVHLVAAGLMPDADPGRRVECLLVDPDKANGTVEECLRLAKSYARCATLETGASPLFAREVRVAPEPWSPLAVDSTDTLDEIFQYTQRQEHQPVESALLELMFSPAERAMPIHQGFRGRPAIGSVVLSHAVHFDGAGSPWRTLLEEAQTAAGSYSSGVPVLLAGSIFGGSGAAGVPTLLQLLREPLRDKVHNARLGLVLFLPYFTFREIPGEAVQADPNAFALAAREALRYYSDRGFTEKADSLYLVGEANPAPVEVSAVGSAAQRNKPHFLELVAGLGAIRFLGSRQPAQPEGQAGEVSLACRAAENTLTWADLPMAEGLRERQVARLQQMVEFAVAFRLNFYPVLTRELTRSRTSLPLLVHLVGDERMPPEQVQVELSHVQDYVTRFLQWLLAISTPRADGWTPGLVDLNVFAERDAAGGWHLRDGFRRDRDFRDLFLNAPGRPAPDLDAAWKRANQMRVDDPTARGTGLLVRTLYDSFAL